MKLPETCLSNQWDATVLNLAIHDAAVAEQCQRAVNGEIVTLRDMCMHISIKWLDAMMPAGNC